MPVKDTIKVVDEKNYVKGTPERKTLWLVQTPQVFDVQLIKEAYQKLIDEKIRKCDRRCNGSRADDGSCREIIFRCI